MYYVLSGFVFWFLSILSMCKLLEHTINNGDRRLNDIVVKGERIFQSETGIILHDRLDCWFVFLTCTGFPRRLYNSLMICLGPVHTSNFSCAESIANQFEQRILPINTRFGAWNFDVWTRPYLGPVQTSNLSNVNEQTWKVRRLNWALIW